MKCVSVRESFDSGVVGKFFQVFVAHKYDAEAGINISPRVWPGYLTILHVGSALKSLWLSELQKPCDVQDDIFDLIVLLGTAPTVRLRSLNA
jgi:hypothetical protein